MLTGETISRASTTPAASTAHCIHAAAGKPIRPDMYQPNAPTNRAQAGTGNPTNSRFWSSETLNRASRNAPQAVISSITALHAPYPPAR